MADLTDPALDELHSRLAPAGVTAIRPLTGGASSLTYSGRIGERPVVVKVAPAGVTPVAHRDVLRQARVLKALEYTEVPVPQVIWEDSGNPPEEPPLFVMSLLPGSSAEPLFDANGPAVAELAEAVVAARFHNAAAAMAHLHRLRPAAVGVGTEPVLAPEAEIDRWSRTLETVDQSLVPGWRDVQTELRSSVPAALGPAIVHGDFRLGNLLAEGERITAVIDWEIWSVSDPRIDVGWFLINSDPETYRRRTAHSDAVPSIVELADTYCGALGTRLADLSWFQALACFKSAATWSLIVKHNRRRSGPDPELEAMALQLPRLLERALHHLG